MKSKVTFVFLLQDCSNNSYKIHIFHSTFGSNCQEIRNNLHVPIPLLPMSQVRRLGELDPLDFRKLIEEGLETSVVDFVVSSVGQQCPVRDFGDAVED